MKSHNSLSHGKEKEGLKIKKFPSKEEKVTTTIRVHEPTWKEFKSTLNDLKVTPSEWLGEMMPRVIDVAKNGGEAVFGYIKEDSQMYAASGAAVIPESKIKIMGAEKE